MTVGPQPDPCNLPSWQRCPSCGAPLVNRAYTLCDPCAGHDAFAEIDATTMEPFLKPCTLSSRIAPGGDKFRPIQSCGDWVFAAPASAPETVQAIHVRIWLEWKMAPQPPPQPSALAVVWARVCKTIGGMW